LGDRLKLFLAKATFVSFIIQGLGALLFLLIDVIVARRIGVEQFGIYSIAKAWMNILALISTLGLNHLLLRFVPEYLSNKDFMSLKGVIRWSSDLVTATSICILLLGVLLLSIFNYRTPSYSSFIWIMFSLPFIALSSLRQSVLRGLGSFAYALSPEFIIKPILILLTLSFFVTTKINAAQSLQIIFFSILITYFISTFWQKTFLPLKVKESDFLYHIKQWKDVAISMFLVVGLGFLSIRIDIVILGLISGVENVGVYAAASRLADMLVFSLVAANIAVTPMISGFHTTKKYFELQSMIKLVARGIFFFTVPLIIIMIIFGHEFLGFFGNGFENGYSMLILLMIGQLASICSGPVGPILMMTGFHKSVVKFTAICALFNLILNLLLIPFFGMIGAALATSMSLILLNLMMLIKVKRSLGLNPTIFSIRLVI
jgi:O-antigen/teichoic acid export membrane protein